MKSTQKITRVKLKIEQNDDYILLGLVSAEPDYKLSLILNKKLGISLRNISPICFHTENNSEIAFSRFSNNNDHADMIYNLISNRNGKNFLLQKLKNIDFLLQIQILDEEVNLTQITSRLREIESLSAVFNIDFNTIKDKNLHYLTQ